MSAGGADGAEAPVLERRNLRAVSVTSFLTDLSSEMVLNLLPLYLAGPLGLKANVIGLIEGVAEAVAGLLKVLSGWLSDRLGRRKALAVAGYAVSALAKPLFLASAAWPALAGARWLDRVGKGVRTAPRDALLADSAGHGRRGRVFGWHRAADTAGAVLGIGVALAVVAAVQGAGGGLGTAAFRIVVLLSLVPAFLAVAALAVLAREVPVPASRRPLPLAWRGLGRRFAVFLAIAAVFDLGDAADAFIVLLADARGLGVVAILAMLLTMNLVYALVSGPAGVLADRLGRRPVLAAGWGLYALVYLGFALAGSGTAVWVLAAVYGVYLGLTHGTARALIADLVPPASRGTAYGTFHAVLALIDVPASLIAGVLWHGFGSWQGSGPAASFAFGAAAAAVAAVSLARWRPAGDQP